MLQQNNVSGEEQTVQAISWPGSPFGVVRGFTYGYAGTGVDVFVPHVRELGVGMVRLFLLWSQIEPEPGHYVWDVVGMNGR